MRFTLTLPLFCVILFAQCSHKEKTTNSADNTGPTKSNTVTLAPIDQFKTRLQKIRDSDFVPSDTLFNGFSFRMKAADFKAAKARLKTTDMHIDNSPKTYKAYILNTPLGQFKASTIEAYYDDNDGLKGLLIIANDPEKHLLSNARTVWGQEQYTNGPNCGWLKSNWNVEIAAPPAMPSLAGLTIYDAKRSNPAVRYHKVN